MPNDSLVVGTRESHRPSRIAVFSTLSTTVCAIEQYDPSAPSEAGVTLRDASEASGLRQLGAADASRRWAAQRLWAPSLAASNGIVTPNESVAVAGWFDSTVSQPNR